MEKLDTVADDKAKMSELAEHKMLLRLTLETIQEFTAMLGNVTTVVKDSSLVGKHEFERLRDTLMERIRLAEEKGKDTEKDKSKWWKRGIGSSKRNRRSSNDVDNHDEKDQSNAAVHEGKSSGKDETKASDQFELSEEEALLLYDELAIQKDRLRSHREQLLAEEIYKERKKRAAKGDFAPLWIGSNDKVDEEKAALARKLAQSKHAGKPYSSRCRIEHYNIASACFPLLSSCYFLFSVISADGPFSITTKGPTPYCEGHLIRHDSIHDCCERPHRAESYNY